MGGNIPGGNFSGWEISGGGRGFSTREFDRWEFSGWEISQGGIFLEPLKIYMQSSEKSVNYINPKHLSYYEMQIACKLYWLHETKTFISLT